MKITKRGFTLTEVLVVVLIISVLAAIVYPMYTKSVTRSRAVEAMNLLEMVRNKQLQKFARDKEYYTDLSKVGQLTTDTSKVTVDGDKLKVNDYTLSLDTVKNCMRAEYKKGSTEFTFSASYDKAGLGCSGAICSSFGNITSSADEVCGCNLTCSGGFTLDTTSCSCVCSACDVGGQCIPPFQNQPLSESCGNGGVRTRTCTPSCGGGDCTAWGLCGSQNCDAALKPAASQGCGNCGTQTRTVTCNQNTGVWSTGAWGSCSGSGVCSPGATQTCNGGGTQTCSSSCTWNSCGSVACDQASKPSSSQSCGNCNSGTQTRTVTCNTSNGTWTTGTWGSCSGGGECAAGTSRGCGNGSGTQTCSSSCVWGACSSTDCDQASKPAESQSCGNCNSGTQTRTVTCNTSTGAWTTGAWGTCTGGGICAPGATQSCSGGTQTCSSSCAWGTCVQTVTPVTRTTKVLTTCGAVSGGTCLSYTYELCQPGSGSWAWPTGYNPDNCRSRTTYSVCYDDYIQGSADQFSCQTWSLPSCSGSNYQSICNANGKGYKCKISAGGGTGNAATACMCDWYNGGYSGSYCDDASGLSCVTIYFGGEGTGSYLSCE